MRPLISVAFGVLAWAAMAGLRAPPVSDAEGAGFDQACRYYGARAAMVRPAQPGAFVVILAEACSRAERLLVSGTPEQRRRSAVLLDRIAALRATVVRLNAAAAGRGGAGDLPVTPSGEFLIAHRLGVLMAFNAWLDTGVQFSVASYP